jgi:methyl-accepting chemotaxis protein
MKSLAARALFAIAAAALPALLAAGLLGAMLVVVVRQVEADVDVATATARTVNEIRVLLEKERGLIARLPGELDLGKVDGYAREVSSIDTTVDTLVASLEASRRVVSPDVIAQIREIRRNVRRSTAAIVEASKSFAQSTALELVNGAFESDTGVTIALLDAIASNVDAIAEAARAELRSASYWVWRLVPAAFLIAMLAAALSLWALRRQVIAPLAQIGAGMRRLAESDRAVDTSSWPRDGELGQMTLAVERFRESATARERLQAERDADFQETTLRGRRVAELAKAFETEAGTVIGQLGTASVALAASADAMMKAAAESDARAHDVAASTGEANMAANAVASAAEEVHASIESIEERIVSAQAIAGEATAGARGACGTMAAVVDRSKAIETVIGLIDSIAQETNLLALNATIEAARAGDMGRGFGVVASEVKALANQTARATGQVTAQIHALQGASGESARAVDGVTAIITRLDEIATAIAQVMRQQSEATREISASALRAADGTTNVLQSIGGMTDASKRTRGVSDDVNRAAADLAAQSERLAATVRNFLNGLAAA